MRFSWLKLCRAAANGAQILVEVTGGIGGGTQELGMEISTGSAVGKWLTFSLEGNFFDPGYYHLTTLKVPSLEAASCEPGSVGQIGGVVSDLLVGL